MMPRSDATLFHNPSQDPEMDQAQPRHAGHFVWRELAWEQRPIVLARELAAVKATFHDPPELQAQTSDDLACEHLWIVDFDFDGRRVEGTLSHAPYSFTSISEGDHVTAMGKQICDWIHVIANDVNGGYTIGLLRARRRCSTTLTSCTLSRHTATTDCTNCRAPALWMVPMSV